MFYTIPMILFGILTLSKSEIKIINNRIVKDSVRPVLGVALLLGAAAILIPRHGVYIQIIIFLAVIIIGLITSQKIESKE